jgi:biotin carboxylase
MSAGSANADAPTVAVIGAGYAGKRAYYERLAALDTRLVILDEPSSWSEQLAHDIPGTAWLPMEISGEPDRDAEEILSVLERSGTRPDGVLTFFENYVCETARVARALGLPGNPPEAVDSARSKVRTRELSVQLGFPTPIARRVRSLDELFAAAGEVGFPAVVKPEFGASAAGCVRVDGFGSPPGVYRIVREHVTSDRKAIFRAGNDLLVEQYLDGVEFDVDAVMQDGEVVFTSVSQNWPTAEPSFQETGLHLPPTAQRAERD